MSNSLDTDHAQRFVMPDLGPNCLKWLSVGNTSNQRVNLSLSLTALPAYRPCHEKTCLLGCDMVKFNLACSVTETSYNIGISHVARLAKILTREEIT